MAVARSAAHECHSLFRPRRGGFTAGRAGDCPSGSIGSVTIGFMFLLKRGSNESSMRRTNSKSRG